MKSKKNEKSVVQYKAEDQDITKTLETNFMPYAMSVIISRAIPEIDGFKPSHRKLLYTMYKMGLLNGQLIKSANVVGQTMHFNPHGDASIYETLVRLTRGNESLLHPFIESKGSFGKQYSRDMAYAASRYTECTLAPICNEIFDGIDKNAVDMIPNYDNSTLEPSLLPTKFPNILVSPNSGIAVSMKSDIPSFNLSEICDGTIALLKNPSINANQIIKYIKGPDFPGGAYIVYNQNEMINIFKTGNGAIKLRARYKVEGTTINISQIPYSTNIESIIDKITFLIKNGKYKEISDIRDEIDKDGFKLAIDVKRGTDCDNLMNKLFKVTPLESSYNCIFNVIIDSNPKQLGLVDILNEWIKFRLNCLKRELSFNLEKMNDRLHLLKALGKILLDIDKAIKIIRNTDKDSDVIPRLMSGFDIDKKQAEYIAEIKLRNLNKEYISNKIKDIIDLEKEIKETELILSDEFKQKKLIIDQLSMIKKKYGKPRKTLFIDDQKNENDFVEEDRVSNYSCEIIVTKEGYLKKIQSIQKNSQEIRLKEGDEVLYNSDATNNDQIIVFSNKSKVYKSKISDFDITKPSSLGEYLPSYFLFEEDEKIMLTRCIEKFNINNNIIFIFENGKAVKIPIDKYDTKSNRKKLCNAYSTVSAIVSIYFEDTKLYILLKDNKGKAILVSSNLISSKSTRTSNGNIVFSIKKGDKIVGTKLISESNLVKYQKFKKNKIPSKGVIMRNNNEKK